MIIYFRCTSKEETVSGVDRWIECPKDEIVLKCWMSLQLAAKPKNHKKFFGGKNEFFLKKK